MFESRTRQSFTPIWRGIEHSPRQGFTLAEVLITLGIIGVVASMTIPTLVANYQERSYNTAATVFERKLGEALKVMNSQSALAGFDSTEDFVDELSKHFKINKVCQNDELMECFEEEVLWGSGTATPEAVDMSIIKTTKNFGQKDWQETNVVGVQFASGVTALIAYNTNASQDPYSNQIITFSGSSNGRSGSVNLGTNALAILYDTNGAKSPNQSSKDLRSINVTKLGQGCFAEIDGMCLAMAPQLPTPHVWNACDTSGNTTNPDDLAFMSKYGISKCMSSIYGKNDYWAGAVEACGGIDKMASAEDIEKIGYYVYTNNKYDETKAVELNLPTPQFRLWTNEENGITAAYNKVFYNTPFSSSSPVGDASSARSVDTYLMVCIGD